VIEGAGAYCAGMASKNYNSFPECAETLRQTDGKVRLIRKRQEPEAIWANEVI
jgi:diaminopimelate decarboxylase